MPDDGTNQTPPEEANLDPAAVAQPEGGEATPQDAEPNTAADPESLGLTADQIREIQEFQASMREANVTDAKAFMADYTRKAQEAAALQAQLEQQQQTLQALAGREQARVNPTEAARQAWQRAKVEYDPSRPNAEEELHDAYIRQLVADASQQTLLQARQEAAVQRALPQAAAMLGIDNEQLLSQQLTEVGNSLNPAELALIKLHRDGKATEYLTAEVAAKEQRAKEALAVRSLGEAGGARSVPGAARTERQVPEADFMSFSAWSKDARKRWVDAGGIVVMDDGEVVEDPLG
jgi:hypothetical protein